MKRILFILFLVPVFVLAQSEGFIEPTFNTLIEKTYFKDLYQNGSADCDWDVYGDGIVEVGEYYYLSNESYLLSPEFDGNEVKSLDISLNLKLYNGNSENNKYFIGIEYAGGEIIEESLVVSSNQYKLFHFRFEEIKSEKFRIRIKSQMKSLSTSCIAVDYILVKSISKAPSLSFEASNTGFSVAGCGDYDECVLELYRQTYIESGIDTLYFNQFDDDSHGIIVNTSYNISNGGLYITGKSSDICASIPFLPNRNIDKLNLKCLFRIASKKNHNVNIYYNDEFVVENKMSGSGGEIKNFFCEIDVRHTFTDTLKFIVNAFENSTANLVFDELLLSQDCEYKYTVLEDFPRHLQFPLSIDGLDCTSSYRVRYQLIDNENEKGEKVVTSLAEGFVSTTGEYKELPPDSDFTLESDFEGTIMISNKSNLYGNYSVLGELCYVHEYNPDEWASVALPFKPQRIGAFKNGEGFYLRENKDFYLRSYSETDDNFQFIDSETIEPYQGYILKIPEGMDFDNNALFIYSPRKIEINTPYSYVFDNLYCHVANPYMYSLSYRDNGAEIESIFHGNMIYKFDGTSFKLLSSDDTIRPFESLIVYLGGVNGAPRMISLENDVSNVADDKSGNEYIFSVFEDGVEIHGYNGPVEVYGIDGNIVVRTFGKSGERITIDGKGVYIVRFGNNINKILL